MPEIKEVLENFNPWWKGKLRLNFKYREVYYKLQKFLDMPQIMAFTGLRRVGKTTLMLKMAQDSIEKGFNPRNILYFSFDEFKAIELRKLLNVYEEIMECDLNNGRYLLMLDEIQKLDNWENQLKVIYDTLGKNIRLVISGSESLFIRKKSKETLAGRIFDFKIEPLTFSEFLSFKEINLKPIGIYKKELNKLLNEYILTLGFPELVNVNDKEIIKKYIKESIIERVIFKDIPNLFNIRDVSVLESLLNLLIEQPGQIVELLSLSRDLGISRHTLSSYLKYLEDSFLVKKLYNYSKNRRKIERKLKKYYPTIVSPELLFKNDEISKSKVFEWLVVMQLNTEFFWRDPYKNEVDAVIFKEKAIPIEVKYGKADTKGILAFMKKFNANLGIIITKDKEEKQKIDNTEILFVPAFKFLLNSEKVISKHLAKGQ